ncbi:MAG: lysyl-tRNA synthetase, class II [archaeon GW2011_AR9]|nr:MAG: lysyl-tRNA synthetase, class II [archaeon GW2011_AR9]HIH12209.1 lysine--tRNA ligase [Candidatus Woesearchaeota archaeon]
MSKKLEIDENKLQRLHELQLLGINPYPYTFNQTHHAASLNEKYAGLKPEEHTKDKVSVAGRIMLKRVMGKAAFFQIQDQSGKVQLYLAQDILNDTYQTFAKKVDIGDIIGVEGRMFKTRMGEVTIEVHTATILCKSLLLLPEKFHGLKDIEIKYRHRYLDLIVNPDVKQVFMKRSQMISTIRNFFTQKGFIEVETPTLQTIYGGANAKPFITHINAWDMNMYLSISPELYLKRLLVGGFEKVFTICKNFRNEDADTSHNPEFTMLEAYQSYVDYTTMMELLEQVYEKSCIAMNGSTLVKKIYQGEEVTLDFKAPWKRMTFIDAIKHYAKIDVSHMSEEHLMKLLRDYHLECKGTFSWGTAVQALFEVLVEDKLIQPIHIIDHPKETTPLCKAHPQDPRLIERFESFCLGMELSNAYSELNDPIIQRKLLEEQAKELRAGSDEAHPMDEDFLNAMEYGLPPAGGLGFGIDRMAIILTGVDSIRDVILFPTMKPVEDEKIGKEK